MLGHKQIILLKCFTLILVWPLIGLLIINSYYYIKIINNTEALEIYTEYMSEYVNVMDEKAQIPLQTKRKCLELFEEQTPLTFKKYPDFFYPMFLFTKTIGRHGLNMEAEIPITILITEDFMSSTSGQLKGEDALAVSFHIHSNLTSEVNWKYLIHRLSFHERDYTGLLAHSNAVYGKQLHDLTDQQLSIMVESIPLKPFF